MERLRANGDVPSVDRAVDQVPKPFPSVLSVLLETCEGVYMRVDTKDLPTSTKVGRYSVSRIREIHALSEYGFKLEGTLSPLSPITVKDDSERNKIGIPTNSVSFAFAYPVDGAENLAKIRESSPHTLQCFTAPSVGFFACYGGYVYFDKNGELVGCTALSSGSTAQGAREMSPQEGWSDPELVQKLHTAG